MKNFTIISGITLAGLLAGCASTPMAVAPVGPNPAAMQRAASTGQLEVFSALRWRSEGDNPTWQQHTDYSVYDQQGQLVRQVNNTIGRYEETPRHITLPPGKYTVKARAMDYFLTDVPVVIKRGKTTVVHLDDHWTVPSQMSKSDVVTLPNGNPVGWNAGLTQKAE